MSPTHQILSPIRHSGDVEAAFLMAVKKGIIPAEAVARIEATIRSDAARLADELRKYGRPVPPELNL